MTLKEHVQQRLDINKRERSRLAAVLKFFDKNNASHITLEKGCVSFYGRFLDIDQPTRQEVEQILKTVRVGKWTKTSGTDGTIHYESATPVIGDLKIRLWQAEPPGTCRLVEEEVVIPAQPERREIRKVLHCEPVAGERP
jgi:hypothetical protein